MFGPWTSRDFTTVVDVVHVAEADDHQARHAVSAVPVSLLDDGCIVGGVAGLGRGPFPGIADQLLDPVAAVSGPERGRAGGHQGAGRVAAAHAGVDLVRPGGGIAPGVPGAVRAPGDPFPLGFGGQPPADPGAELRRVVRRHPHDGTGAVAVREARVVGGLVRLGALLRLHAVAVLLVGDLVDVHQERRER